MRLFKKKPKEPSRVIITLSDDAKALLAHFSLTPEEERKKLLAKYSDLDLLFLGGFSPKPSGLKGVPLLEFSDDEHTQNLLNIIFKDKKGKLTMESPYPPGKIVGAVDNEGTISRVSSDSK